MSKTVDAQELKDLIPVNGPEQFFVDYVERDTELTFNGTYSMLVPKVEREAMKVAFEGAKRFYHTADSYLDELYDSLDKHNLLD